jgi:NitT/TauT family transport system substrate-binding protein
MKRALAAAAAAAIVLAGCSSAAKPASPVAQKANKARAGGAVGLATAPPVVTARHRHALRLGFVASIPEAIALVGVRNGYFQVALGTGTTLDAIPYPTPAAEAAALAAGQLDAAYIDPIAAVHAWQATRGAITIIAGAASGGAQLITSPRITQPAQLAGRPVAAPDGSAQQAALGSWRRQHGQPSAAAPASPALSGTALVSQFKAGTIAGAWAPAPFDAQMAAAGGHILVSEASQWPGGQYSTAVLAVTSKLLTTHPALVQALLKGHIQAEDQLATRPEAVQAAAQAELASLGQHLQSRLFAASLAQVRFTNDPLAATISAEAQHAAAAGLIKPAKTLTGLFDLRPLNRLLRAIGQKSVAP